MKAVLLKEFVKSYDELAVSQVEVPSVPEGHVLVKIKAVGLNFVDLLYARGKHQNNTFLHRPPFILGTEFSGTVISANPPSLLSTGTQVMGSFLGSFATHIVVPIAAIQTLPPGWDLISAAGVSSTLPVSHGALLRARIQPGETVLVHAAAGGLGLMAVQLAKALGCTVIGTASTRDKRAVASRYGCDHVVDYTVTGWDKEVMQLTGGKGADIVYDPVGLISESVRCTAHFGRILIIGFAGREGNMENVKMNRLLLKQIEVIGYRFGETHRRRPAETKKVWEELERLVKEGKIKPTVYDGDYRGLESIPRAMRDMADRKVWGKAVIVVDEEDAASKAKI